MAKVENVNPSGESGYMVSIGFGEFSIEKVDEQVQSLRKDLCEACPLFVPGQDYFWYGRYTGCLGARAQKPLQRVDPNFSVHVSGVMNMNGTRQAACLTDEQKDDFAREHPAESVYDGDSSGSYGSGLSSGYRGGW